jgi:hypothetical protein
MARPYVKRIGRNIDRDIETLSRLRTSAVIHDYEGCTEVAMRIVEKVDSLIEDLKVLRRHAA